jgi:1-acyl-sn-glycerol-3-phosphate acyltransferase
VSWTGRRNPAQPAAAWAALHSGTPVLLVALLGTYDVWPRWQQRMNCTGRITVRFGQPFILADARPNRITPEMLDQAGERIMAEIGRLVEMGQ